MFGEMIYTNRKSGLNSRHRPLPPALPHLADGIAADAAGDDHEAVSGCPKYMKGVRAQRAAMGDKSRFNEDEADESDAEDDGCAAEAPFSKRGGAAPAPSEGRQFVVDGIPGGDFNTDFERINSNLRRAEQQSEEAERLRKAALKTRQVRALLWIRFHQFFTFLSICICC